MHPYQGEACQTRDESYLPTLSPPATKHGSFYPRLGLMNIPSQGDQYRRLHPERSLLDRPTEHGIYSLNLKQQLLDKMTEKQTKAKEAEALSEPDTSSGLSSRLNRVKITGDSDDLLNGNVSAKSDGNGNKPLEKTIVLKDKPKPSTRSSEVTL